MDQLEAFLTQARGIKLLHFQQQERHINQLNEKYAQPILGQIGIWDALQQLKSVVDPSDKDLYQVTQWDHSVQVIHGMEEEGIDNEEWLVAGWIHDLGKLLLLHGEHPANVVCDNYVVTHKGCNCGLDNCLLQWNHDEFVYMKFKDLLPNNILWLVRYHSIILKDCRQYMSFADVKKANQYLMSFKKFDKGTKSSSVVPAINLDKHQKLLESWFPQGIVL